MRAATRTELAAIGNGLVKHLAECVNTIGELAADNIDLREQLRIMKHERDLSRSAVRSLEKALDAK